MLDPPYRTALVYDFDGTLARGNIQEHSFIPQVGLTKEEFWGEVKDRTRVHDADEILVYMDYILETAFDSGHPVTREALESHGRDTPLFDGLGTWLSE